MGIYHLDRMFRPDSVAVVGASPKSDPVGGAVMTNLTQVDLAPEAAT